jgi:hypothetical protein
MIVGDMMIAPAKLTEVFGISPAGGDVNWLQLELVVNGAKVRMLLSDNPRLAPLRLTTQLPSDVNE